MTTISRRHEVGRWMLPFLIFAAAAPVCTPGAQEREISGGETHLRIRLEEAGGGMCRFVLAGMSLDGEGEARVDLSMSPIWQVDLRRRSQLLTSGALDASLLPAAADVVEKGGLLHPCDRMAFEHCDGAHCELVWEGVPLAGEPGETLSARAVVDAREDGMLLWDLSLSLTPGDLFLHAVRFPIFVIEGGLGRSASDDQLLLPYGGGYLYPDVLGDPLGVHHPKATTGYWDDPNDLEQRGDGYVWIYGTKYMPMQFLAYLDGPQRDSWGLLLATDDGRGFRKKLYGNKMGKSGAAANRIALYPTHFSSIRHTGQTLEEDDLFSFDLSTDFGYRVLVRPFSGDWIDAAEIYRGIVTGNGVVTTEGWLRRGKLEERPELARLMAAPIGNVMYIFPPDQPPSWERDLPNLEETVAFLRSGYPTSATLPVTFMTKSNLAAYNLGSSDNCYVPSAEALYELLREARRRTGASFIFNHDTGKSYFGQDAQIPDVCLEAGDPATILDPTEIERSGLLKRIDGEPYLQNANGPFYAAFGPWWLDTRSFGFARRRFLDAKSSEGAFGVQVAMLSGTMAVPSEDWAPLDPMTDLERNDHPLGGGNHHYEILHEAFASLERFARGETPENPDPIADFRVLSERSAELWIDELSAALSVVVRPPRYLFLGVVGQSGEMSMGAHPVQLPAAARKIPLYSYVYRDYVRRGSNFLFGDAVRAVYGSGENGEDGHLQYQYAVAYTMVVAGEAFTMVVIPGSPTDDVPGRLTGTWLRTKIYLRDLSDLLYASSHFSLYARLARPPRIESSTIPLTVCEGFTLSDCSEDQMTVRQEAAIVGAAYRHEDGSVGFYLTNWTDSDAQFSAEIAAADYGLSDGTALCLFDPEGDDRKIATIANGGARVEKAMNARTALLVYAIPGESACPGFP